MFKAVLVPLEGTYLADAARERSSDLIVMASRGPGGIADAVLGSTAERVARSAKAPVLVIPAAYDQPWDADPQFRILVPLDGSSEAEVALTPARALCEVFKGSMVLVRLTESGGRTQHEPEPTETIEHARAYLESLGSSLRATGLQVDWVAQVGQPGEVLAHVAEERDADLIVIASHGRGGFKRLALGSVTEATLRGARVPVLVVRRQPPQS